MTPDIPTDFSTWDELTIAVPLYSRPDELRHLLESVSNMTVLPGEVLLCEDHSPERVLLRQIATEWTSILAAKGCSISYKENSSNLGYDGNLRNLFEQATRPWVLLLGNDDAMLPSAIPSIRQFIADNPGIQMASRTFVRFKGNIKNIVGVTRLSTSNRVFTQKNAKPGYILRLCGFVGGLLIRRDWAVGLATTDYDGTLYYQMFLAAMAFSNRGIGYIAEPVVGSRVGNPPMFGSASSEKGVHVPGAYSPAARAAMWQGIIRICTDVEKRTRVKFVTSVRFELSGRQSFHVFELVAGQGRYATLGLVREFYRLGLMRHPLPWALATVGIVLGRWTHRFFGIVRNAQKWSAGYRCSAPVKSGRRDN